MLAAEDESEAEVRRQDQTAINRFACLNARLHEVRREQAELKVRFERWSSPRKIRRVSN